MTAAALMAARAVATLRAGRPLGVARSKLATPVTH